MMGSETHSDKESLIGFSSCSLMRFGQRGCSLHVLYVQEQTVPPNPPSSGCIVSL